MTPKTFVLLGHPVSHSVSPAIHTAAYRALGLPHRYELVDCPDEAAVQRQVERLQRGEIAGANVTVPWKRLALALADQPDDSARKTRVANVLARDEGGRITASNTDAVALSEEIFALTRTVRSAAVIGGGGAAQAAVVAAQMCGAREVTVTSRGWRAGEPVADWKSAADFSALGAEPLAWPGEGAPSSDAFMAALRRADVIVQATSAGMHGAGPGEAVSVWIPWRELARGAVALDVVYNPPVTPFLAAAQSANLSSAGGLGMLVRQAAAAIRIWLGGEPGFVPPDLAPLQAAAEAALSSARRG